MNDVMRTLYDTPTMSNHTHMNKYMPFGPYISTQNHALYIPDDAAYLLGDDALICVTALETAYHCTTNIK